MKLVTVYVRKNCSACHNALRLLEGVRDQHPFELQTIDIDADLSPDEARRQHLGLRIPVVEIDGQVVCEQSVAPAKLTRLLYEAHEGV